MDSPFTSSLKLNTSIERLYMDGWLAQTGQTAFCGWRLRNLNAHACWDGRNVVYKPVLRENPGRLDEPKIVNALGQISVASQPVCGLHILRLARRRDDNHQQMPDT